MAKLSASQPIGRMAQPSRLPAWHSISAPMKHLLSRERIIRSMADSSFGTDSLHRWIVCPQ